MENENVWQTNKPILYAWNNTKSQNQRMENIFLWQPITIIKVQ